MIVSQIRPFSEMPALELNTNMFLDVDPHEHYLTFAVDDNGKSAVTQNMMDMLVKYPGVGELTVCFFYLLLEVDLFVFKSENGVKTLRGYRGEWAIHSVHPSFLRFL